MAAVTADMLKADNPVSWEEPEVSQAADVRSTMNSSLATNSFSVAAIKDDVSEVDKSVYWAESENCRKLKRRKESCVSDQSVVAVKFVDYFFCEVNSSQYWGYVNFIA